MRRKWGGREGRRDEEGMKGREKQGERTGMIMSPRGPCLLLVSSLIRSPKARRNPIFHTG